MKDIIKNFLKSDKRTLSVCGMVQIGAEERLQQIEQIIREASKQCVALSSNSRLAFGLEKIKSIYSHLYINSAKIDKLSQDNENHEFKKNEEKSPHEFELVAEEEKRSSSDKSFFKVNKDEQDCIYLLSYAHLLSDSRFVTPDGKQYGSGILLDDFFEFIDLKNSQRKVIFLVDPYQIQRNKDLLSRCNEVFRLPLSDPDALNSAQLRNSVRLAHAIERQQFAVFDLESDTGISVQNDKMLAIQQILSDYRENYSVWYLAETHSQTQKLTKWLRLKLFQKNQVSPLEIGDWLEIYVWKSEVDNGDGNPIEPKGLFSGKLVRVKEIGHLEKISQPLKGRDKDIVFHRLTCTLQGGDTMPILLEFLTAEKPELDADTAIALKVWKRDKNKEETDTDTAYVRYGYAATVHHAQGMNRNIVYINCDHSAGKHSEGLFRWLYSALTISENKTVLLNFSSIHPFDQGIWKTQNIQVEIAEKIRIGAGWSWLINSNSDTLKDCLSKISMELGYTLIQITTHSYQEHYRLENSLENFTLRVAFNGKNQVTAFHAEEIEKHWEFLATLSQSCIIHAKYTDNAKMLLNFLIKQLNPNAWRIISAVQENDYRINVTFAKSCDERVNGEINFDKQGLVSSVRILACTQIHLIEELKELLL